MKHDTNWKNVITLAEVIRMIIENVTLKLPHGVIESWLCANRV
jgi:hypothetical protein